MLLRRFIKNVADQNWLAVAIDVLVVFGSVLMATQLSIRIEEEKAQRDLENAMSKVAGEINASAENVAGSKLLYKSVMQSLRAISEHLQADLALDIDTDEHRRAIEFVFKPSPIFIQYELILELQATGGLRNVPQEDLHNMLRELLLNYRLIDAEYLRLVRKDRAEDLGAFPYIDWGIVLEEESTRWGYMKIEDIDWEQASQDHRFKTLITSAHHDLAGLALRLEVTHMWATEIQRMMDQYGFAAGPSWYEVEGEALEMPIYRKPSEVLQKLN